MKPDERIKAARLAYMRAVTSTRSHPTPAGWGRLRAAAKSLSDAVRARGRDEDARRSVPHEGS